MQYTETLQLQRFQARCPEGKGPLINARSGMRARRASGTIYRPVSNISTRSTHSSADLVRTESLRTTIKYPSELALSAQIYGRSYRLLFHDSCLGRSRDRFARFTKMFARTHVPFRGFTSTARRVIRQIVTVEHQGIDD